MTEIQLAILFYAIMFTCALFATIYGCKLFFKKNSALYTQIITCAMGCFTLSYLFSLLQIIVTDEIKSGFQVGNLGLIGAMAFLFSASFGQMDGLVDDHSQKFMKYRLLSLIMPIVILVIYLLSFFIGDDTQTKIVTLIQFIFIGPAVYYNFKHIIILDVELGIVKSVKEYNIVALILEIAITLELFSLNIGNGLLMATFSIIICICYILIIPMLKKGVKRWTL